MVAVSSENGFEAFRVFPGHVNSAMYCQILPDLLKNGPRLAIVHDNVSYHHSKQTKTELKTFNIEAVFTPRYTPDLQPIERVFAIVKHYYKKFKLQSLCHNRGQSVS